MGLTGGQDRADTKLERAAHILRSAIIQGDLEPGKKLNQQELAESLGMSATPIREVLRILEVEGLLTYEPYIGVSVARVSPELALEITPIRMELEGLAVRLGVPNLDDESIAGLEAMLDEMERARDELDFSRFRRINYQFHTTIYQASGSKILCEMIERLWPRFATHVLQVIPGRDQQSMIQHQAIMEAIKQRDTDASARRMVEHIASAGQAIVTFNSSQSVRSLQ